MDRAVIIGLFTALEQLCDRNDLESVKAVVQAVLQEARHTEKEDK